MSVVAVYNLKGGVGKTSTSVNLAFVSAREGARTLLWDLDPQGASSFYLRVKPKVKGGFKRLLRRKSDPRDAIRGTDFPGLDLLPATFAARHLDGWLYGKRKPERRLQRVLKRVRDDYDLIVIDCAPSIGPTAEAVFGAAELLLVPTIPTTLSLETLRRLRKHLGKRKRPRVCPFFSMVDRRKSLHREICEDGRKPPYAFLDTRIPYSSVVEKMGPRRAPVGAFAPGSAPNRAYQNLYREVIGQLQRLAGSTG